MAILIGLTGNSDGAPATGAFTAFGVRPPMYLVSQDYCRAVAAAGAIPVLVPPTPGEAIPAILDRLAGIVFTGGVDLDPALYGEAPHPLLGELDQERDRFETALFEAAWARPALPILGVCRGLQLMNVARGGTLWQDLPSQRPSPVHHSQRDHRYRAVHPVRVVASTRLATILPPVMGVNSLHHQGIKDLAPDLVASALSPDGLVEGIEAPDHAFRLAVQWHPENLAGEYPEFRGLFAALVEAARGAAADAL